MQVFHNPAAVSASFDEAPSASLSSWGFFLRGLQNDRNPMELRACGGALARLTVGAMGVYLFVPAPVQDLTTRRGRTLKAQADDISAQA